MGTIMRGASLFASGFFGIGFVALALITLLPAEASKPNRIGYYGVCSFAPVSTVTLLVLSAAFIILLIKLVRK